MVIKNQKGGASKPAHKAKKAMKILRSSSGALMRTRKTTGFIKSSILSQTSNRLLQRIGEKRKGQRQKMREQIQNNKALIEGLPKKKNVQEHDDEDVQTGADKPNYFDVSDELKLTAEDEKLLSLFKSSSFGAMEHQIADQFDQNLKEQQEIEYQRDYLSNPKVLIVYQDVAELLKTYRSGKLPQPFHVIPTVAHWQELLKLTKPHEWTPQAMNAAVKIFSSSMHNEKAEYFYREILFPAVRKNIAEDKRLNYHYYNALMKGLYKPTAWFKGILFELCKQPDATLKEAQIIGSILHKQSIPNVHGSIAIYKLIQFPYNGPTAVLIKLMIEKKYSLPIRVVHEVIDFFLKFTDLDLVMPVVWHQTLLKFCEFYHAAFPEQKKKELLHLVKIKNHYLISSEIVKAINGKVLVKSGIEEEK